MTDEQKPVRKRGPVRGLGRGLSALMDDFPIDDTNEAQEVAGDIRTVSIALLHANPFQPRRRFEELALKDLAASIEEKGLLQPILVRLSDKTPDGEQSYEIIAGERRWRASQMAGLHEVAVLVHELDDQASLELAIIENIQRKDLTAIEEAKGYQSLIDSFGHRQEDIAQAVGKSRSHIANLLRLLLLPDAVQDMIADGTLTMGHARALLGAQDPRAMARYVLSKGLSVRATEALVAAQRQGHDGGRDSADRASHSSGPTRKDADTRALEADLSQSLGLLVDIQHKGDDGGGTLAIRYATLEQLDDLCQRLSKQS